MKVSNALPGKRLSDTESIILEALNNKAHDDRVAVVQNLKLLPELDVEKNFELYSYALRKLDEHKLITNVYKTLTGTLYGKITSLGVIVANTLKEEK